MLVLVLGVLLHYRLDLKWCMRAVVVVVLLSSVSLLELESLES